MLRRLLRLLGLSRSKPPAPDMTNVIDLGWERVMRRGVMFVGYQSEKDARQAEGTRS